MTSYEPNEIHLSKIIMGLFESSLEKSYTCKECPPFTGPEPGPTKLKEDCPAIKIFAELSNLFLYKWQEFSNEKGRKLCCSEWKDISREELAGYISILLHMQIKKLPEVGNQCSTNLCSSAGAKYYVIFIRLLCIGPV